MTRAVIGFFNVFLIFIGLGCCLPGYGTKIGFSLHMEGICDDFMEGLWSWEMILSKIFFAHALHDLVCWQGRRSVSQIKIACDNEIYCILALITWRHSQFGGTNRFVKSWPSRLYNKVRTTVTRHLVKIKLYSPKDTCSTNLPLQSHVCLVASHVGDSVRVSLRETLS